MLSHTPIGLRIASGALLGLGVGAMLLIAICPLMLDWAYATCAADDYGMLYSTPVMFGYTVPDLVPFTIVLIGFAAIVAFAIQLRPSIRSFATKRFCIVSVAPTIVVVWIAYNKLLNFVSELWWMHL